MKKLILLSLALFLFACSATTPPDNHCGKCDKKVLGQANCTKCVPNDRACSSCESGKKQSQCSKSEKCNKPCEKKCTK